MTKRTCPACNTDWYSADSGGVWICECGVVLPPEKENTALPGGKVKTYGNFTMKGRVAQMRKKRTTVRAEQALTALEAAMTDMESGKISRLKAINIILLEIDSYIADTAPVPYGLTGHKAGASHD